MRSIEHTYVSLLADVARLSGFSEIRGSYEGLHWSLNEAPKLEKLVLRDIELGSNTSLDAAPTWLRRLVAASLKGDAYKLRFLRQLLLFSYKASVTHDDETTERSYQNFIGTNHLVGQFGNGLSRSSPLLLDEVRRHCQSVLSRFRERAIVPFHGPGAVTTSKEEWQHIYSTIEYLYPYSDWFSCYFNEDHSAVWDRADHRDIIEAKLIAVPKDSRGPRLICVHPAESIWIQQGLRVELERAISLHRLAKGPWPQGHVHFDDQSVNGRIALLSSRSRRYATLDMKEASDRISEPLVQILFGSKYKWFGCSRAQKFRIPKAFGLTNVRGDLNCYAPMGNATTFPVQSLVFWAICVASMQRHGFRQPGAVFVFGDDIIVPTECVPAVIDGLESFGLLVNKEKSFWRGAFRESCGIDAFNGVDVTPVRWKTRLDAKHPTELLSLSDIAQRLRVGGYEEAALTAYALLRDGFRARYGKELFVTNNPNHGGIAEYTPNAYYAWNDAYWHKPTQQFASPVWRLEECSFQSPSRGWNHVIESICSLERTGRSSIPSRDVSRHLRLNRGWIRVN